MSEVATQELMNDILATPELETPPAEPDAHRGVIDAITFEKFDSGSSAMKLHLTSLDAAFSTDYLVFLPKAFVEDINVDPSTLPAEEGNNQRSQYTINIANSTKDAELQNLRAIAFEAGRSTEGMTKPTNIEEYVQLHNDLLAGVNVIFTRRPDLKAEDPKFRNRLRVKRILSEQVQFKAKSLKGYRKMWESAS
jgi:hypothetical protein